MERSQQFSVTLPRPLRSVPVVAGENSRGKLQNVVVVSTAILLGAQAVNAEGIPFQGQSDQALLLHFWQLTALTFVPQMVDQDGDGEFVGLRLGHARGRGSGGLRTHVPADVGPVTW